jgi:membrane-associated phospholipid phosphatase
MTRAASRHLVGAALCLAALVLLGAAIYSTAGVALDQRTLAAATRLYEPSAEPAAAAFVSLGDPAWALLIGVALAATALYRRGPRLAAVVLLIPAGAALSTGLLKHTLTQSRFCMCLADERAGGGSWPSGHATLTSALLLAALLVAAPRWRPALAFAGGGALAAFSAAMLVMGWHYPSDVIAGLLMGALWAFAGIALLELDARKRPARSPREAPPGLRDALAPLLAGFSAVALLACSAVIARFGAAEALERGYAAELAALALVVALCGAVATALVLALRR